jgi:hypothetical protein
MAGMIAELILIIKLLNIPKVINSRKAMELISSKRSK